MPLKLQGCPVFVQFNGDSVNREVLEVIGLCLRSGWRFRMCLTSLLKLVFAEMRVVLLCHVSSTLSNKMST